MLLAIGGEDLLSTGEIPNKLLSTTSSCPPFTLPEGRDGHVAFNTPDNKVCSAGFCMYEENSGGKVEFGVNFGSERLNSGEVRATLNAFA